MNDWREAPIGAGVGPGWEPLVDHLWERIREIDPDVQAVQVKEKFGTLAFYYDTGEISEAESNRIERLVGGAEVASSFICEVCGRPGTRDDTEGWLKTLCPVHVAFRKTGKSVPVMIAERL